MVVNCAGWSKGLGADLVMKTTQLTRATHALRFGAARRGEKKNVFAAGDEDVGDIVVARAPADAGAGVLQWMVWGMECVLAHDGENRNGRNGLASTTDDDGLDDATRRFLLGEDGIPEKTTGSQKRRREKELKSFPRRSRKPTRTSGRSWPIGSPRSGRGKCASRTSRCSWRTGRARSRARASRPISSWGPSRACASSAATAATTTTRRDAFPGVPRVGFDPKRVGGRVRGDRLRVRVDPAVRRGAGIRERARLQAHVPTFPALQSERAASVSSPPFWTGASLAAEGTGAGVIRSRNNILRKGGAGKTKGP